MWYNLHANGRGDRNSLHAGCPVGGGLTKWSVNKWVRTKPWGKPAKWIPDHPALERYGWNYRGPESPDVAMGSCTATLLNDAGESADIMWRQPGPETMVRLGMMQRGGLTQMNIHAGDLFQMQSGEKKSNFAFCRKPESNFILSGGFRLLDWDTGNEWEL